jgi:hypothetical protein
MLHRIGRILVAAAALGLCLGLGMATSAGAEKKSRVIKTVAVWVAFDAENKTLTVKVKKPGRKPKDKALYLKKGRDAIFNVKPEGSVLTRTTVKINGLGGTFADVPPGKTVNLYWIPDEKKEGERFASSIDVIFSEEELREKWKSDD